MRARFRFTKLGKVRFTSHRDVARMWERALRRAELPVALTQGFSPRPRLHFGLALPTGAESLGEYLDVDLEDGPAGAGGGIDLAAACALLAPMLPEGIDVEAAGPVEPGQASLQQAVTSCSWLVEVVGPSRAEVADAVGAALAAERIEVRRERKGKETCDDVRPAIASLALAPAWIDQPGGRTWIEAELATQPRGLRPSELVALLHPAGEEGLARRTHQWIDAGGAKREPLTATPAARAEACAP